MSRIADLINQYCPNGVEYKSLHSIGYLYGGLTGKIKTDFKSGNAKYISYKNIFLNRAVDISKLDPVKIDKQERQNEVQVGDVLFTGLSENAEECGMSSVLTQKASENIYLNSFCFGFRLNKKIIFLPSFLKYLFRSTKMRKEIIKTANGLIHFNISKRNFKKIKIPVPPLEVQKEIANILDKFTQLEADLKAELEAELEARQQQYTYYRDELLSFDKDQVDYSPMGKMGKFVQGNGLQKKDFTESGIGCIHYSQLYTHYGTYAEQTKTFTSESLARSLRKAKKGDLVIATTSKDDEGVCKAVAWLGDEEIAVSSDTYIYRHSLNPKYVSYFFQTNEFQKQKRPHITGTKIRRVSGDNISKIKIPVPSYEEQEHIVSILDKFDALVNDISSRLPAEIKACREQYEHYRNQLLTFRKAT